MTAAQRSDCPHCDPEHRDPTSRPWNVRVGPERDSDGQPVYLYAQPTNGAHVAESDAEWLWQLIRDAQSSEPARTEYGFGPITDLTDDEVCDIAVASGWIEDTPEARAAYLAADE